MTPAQSRFLALLCRYVVEKYQWYWKGTQLRAYAGGRVATITADELGGLVDGGYIERVGCAGARLTKSGHDAGRAVAC